MKVGITGHQKLGDSFTLNWLNEELLHELKAIDIEEAYSCLAIGADQLFADTILKMNISLVAVIPCRDYQKTFDIGHRKTYDALLNVSAKKIQLSYDMPSEMAFYEAGKKVVDYSDILFVIWNNQPAKGLGGTADIVEYAEICSKKIIHLNPVDKTKNYINYDK